MPLDNIDNGTTGNTPPAATPPDQQQPTTPASPTQDASAQPQNSSQGTQQSPQAKSPNLEDTLINGVSNPQPDPIANHPLVKKAGVMNAVATALSGGQRYTESIDADGNRVRTPVPVSGRHLALAIAMEAVSGSLAGLSAGRGKGPGAAGLAGFQQVASQQQQQTDRQSQIAQQDADNRATSLARKAQTFEVNSRTMLNSAEAEKYGADAIDKMVEINRASGILDVDPATLENGGQPMTQDELHDGVKSGKISPTDSLGPIVGRVEVTDKNGTKR
jgi:hypothetical protein